MYTILLYDSCYSPASHMGRRSMTRGGPTGRRSAGNPSRLQATPLAAAPRKCREASAGRYALSLILSARLFPFREATPVVRLCKAVSPVWVNPRLFIEQHSLCIAY